MTRPPERGVSILTLYVTNPSNQASKTLPIAITADTGLLPGVIIGSDGLYSACPCSPRATWRRSRPAKTRQLRNFYMGVGQKFTKGDVEVTIDGTTRSATLTAEPPDGEDIEFAIADPLLVTGEDAPPEDRPDASSAVNEQIPESRPATGTDQASTTEPTPPVDLFRTEPQPIEPEPAQRNPTARRQTLTDAGGNGRGRCAQRRRTGDCSGPLRDTPASGGNAGGTVSGAGAPGPRTPSADRPGPVSAGRADTGRRVTVPRPPRPETPGPESPGAEEPVSTSPASRSPDAGGTDPRTGAGPARPVRTAGHRAADGRRYGRGRRHRAQ